MEVVPYGKAADNLRREAIKCIASNGLKPLPLVTVKHVVMVQVMCTLVFDQSLKGKELHVSFADGSVSEQPLLLGLQRRGLPSSVRPSGLRIGAVSQRHASLDYLIQSRGCYLLSNQDVSSGSELSKVEALAAKATQRFFSGRALIDKSLAVDLFHTGSEPAMFGIYRGIVNSLIDRQRAGGGSLVVFPRIFTKHAYQTSDYATPDSPGSSMEAYDYLEPWC